MKTPTCAEIAATCRLSASTVSRALNNNPAIPDDTRNRVVEIARNMGWKPNPLTSAYMAHLRSTRPASFKALLGVIVDFPMPRGPQDLPSHVKRTYHGFEQRAEEYGYKIKAFNLSEPGATPASLDRAIADWNVPGFLITSMSEPKKTLKDMNWARYAMVAFGYSMLSPKIHRVTVNMYTGIQRAIQEAFKMGYRKIGVAVSEEYDRRTNHGVLFPATYMSRELKRGHSIDIFEYRDSDPDKHDAIAKWLRRIRPDLVMGMFGPAVFDRLGWRVPQDVGRVAFDRSAEAPGDAGLDLRYEVCGSLAADVLISQITLNQRGIPPTPVEYTVPCQWVNGKTAPGKR